MPLSWNEIKSRATRFSKEWKDAKREEAEAQSFLIEFLDIFGISRKRVATFEHKIKKVDDHSGYIDLLWPGMILVEMKSRGEDMKKAYKQAKDYCHGLKEHELPKLILICDFHHFHLYNEDGVLTEFELPKLLSYVRLFGHIAGYQQHTFKEQDPVNIKAAMLMGQLHDKLKEIGYTGHNLELYLVRLLFILFADDTNIFERGIFQDYLIQRTAEDGSDLAQHLDALFTILNTPESERLKIIDEQQNSFPYVNGKLFEERLPLAGFDSAMRKILLDSGTLDWGKISPAIFGSLFQSVMNETERRNLGAHYTSEKNILKVIKPLFLDELWSEFEAAGVNKTKLSKLHQKISKLRFLDPACGCGNFLIISYRELRFLELEIVKKLLTTDDTTKLLLLRINEYFLVDVDQFYGIEYEEFPSQIAQVAMWLIDHQMNMIASLAFGEYMPRIPLKKSPVIHHGNSMQVDWQNLIKPLPQETSPLRYNFIFGNPPFLGKQYQNEEQKADMARIFSQVPGAGVLDYVTAWYLKAAQYLNEHSSGIISQPTLVAFVSTNSISQGEQVGILWSVLFNKFKIKIHFAHRTFKWGNEAKGNAAVHVIIIGFSNYDIEEKALFEYDSITSEPQRVMVKNINPYLVAGRDMIITKRREPICKVQDMVKGSMPNDNGYFLLDEAEMNSIIKQDKIAAKYIRKFIGGYEFLNSVNRYCFWLKDIQIEDLKASKEIMRRVALVRESRLKSDRAATQKGASTPTLFGEIRQPETDYLALAEVSSERRQYMAVGFFKKDIIASNKIYTIADATLYSFGILSSKMHISWVKEISGRLKSDYSYSTGIVYNNYPWPDNPSEKQKASVEAASYAVLETRLQFPKASLSDLYDPITMPPALIKAHLQLDKAVDQCYRSQPFTTEAKRIEFLFELYDKYTAGLFPTEKKARKTKTL